MRVAYVTPYYNGACDGRYGRFHDWVHTARDLADPPFEFDVYPFTASNPDETLATRPHAVLGDAASLWGTPKNKVEFLLNAPRVGRALASGSYDVVHVVPMDTIVYPTALAACSTTPLVIGPNVGGWSPVRNQSLWGGGRRSRLKHRARYELKNVIAGFERYDHAVAFSEYHRDILSSFSVPRDRTTVLEAGVDRRFSPAGDSPYETGDGTGDETTHDSTRNLDDRTGEDPPRLLYVGDFSEHKGYPQFLDALVRLERPVTATVVGAGDPDLDGIAARGLDDVVTVEGFVPRSELPKYYRESDLYVVPTLDETAGTNTQIEALACGTPVVVTDAPGVNEFAPAGGSVSFAPRTVERLADAIATALDDLDELTRVAREHAPNYSAERPLAQLDGLYRDLLAEC